jgi:hypothetical protein
MKMATAAAIAGGAAVSENMRGSRIHRAMRSAIRTKSTMNQGTNAGEGLKVVPRGKRSGAVITYPDNYPETGGKKKIVG